MYEALLLGIYIAKKLGVRILKAQGDAELIVKQVWSQYFVKNPPLRNYKNRVWDEIEGLDAFSIQAIPREQNAIDNLLVVSSSLQLPHPDFKEK